MITRFSEADQKSIHRSDATPGFGHSIPVENRFGVSRRVAIVRTTTDSGARSTPRE